MPSMHVLHVIDPSSPGGGGCTLRLLGEVVRHLSSVQHETVILGSAAHVALARRCGLEPTGSIPLVLDVPMAGRRSLARTIAFYESTLGRYDLIHAWTARSATVATIAAPDRPRIGTLSVGPVTGFATHLMTMVLQQHPMALLTTSQAVRYEYRSLGLRRLDAAVLAPAVNPALLTSPTREDLRQRWGADDDAFIIGLLSEPVSWADAGTAVEVVGRLVASGRSVKLLVHPTAGRRQEACRWARDFGDSDMVIVDDEAAEPWRVVNGLDAALLIGGDLNSQNLSETGSPFALLTGGGKRLRPMPGVMPLLWAMAGGIPVIAEASDAVKGIVEEGISGLLVRPGDMNGACNRLARLYDDRTIAGRIGASAREQIGSTFNMASYCVRLKGVYERVAAGQPVVVATDANDPVVESRTFSA